MDRSFWHQWAQSLQRYHLRGLSLVLLEGTGPLKIVLAQFMLCRNPVCFFCIQSTMGSSS